MLRCMPNQKSLMMEDMSVAFVQALCAANGYSISKCNHDNDGWDLSIEWESEGQVH